ncbi:MAG: hypothetical protein KZQ82_00960 [Candidatus Thiodiazotropha sp. (ex Lucinoma annulata)]|nr:hypothetical protein [Candidatus Thiodiazotropha sp. (ex Lucinoma annulata)]
MRWIDFENKKPTDFFSGWTPWTTVEWDAWQAKSLELLDELCHLNQEADKLRALGDVDGALAKIKERNTTIDNNRDHWGKLKPWLFALSNGKCWFTEARDIASHMDVEHFRPKKEAKALDGAVREGYWWLAFDYSNFRAAGNVPNRKKGGWFPLHKSSQCSTYAARCEEAETPYLLDPIRQADVDLLAFDEEGNAIPTPDANDWEKERVEISIERLKMNDHDALPQERRRVWQNVSEAIEGYLNAKSKYRPGVNQAPAEKMEEKLRQIKKLTNAEAELSSVALWCVRFRNDPQLIRLVS